MLRASFKTRALPRQAPKFSKGQNRKEVLCGKKSYRQPVFLEELHPPPAEMFLLTAHSVRL